MSQGDGDVTYPVIIVHRYYAPDTPVYAQMLGMIAARLAEHNETLVISGDQRYRTGARLGPVPRHGRLTVQRTRLVPETRAPKVTKSVNAVLFAVEAAVLVSRQRGPGAVMAATTPPLVVSRLVSWAARVRGRRFIYHNQDIYPEVLGNGTSALRRLMRRIDVSTGRAASVVVVLSEDMKRLWRQRGVSTPISVIPNFLTDEMPDLAGRIPSGQQIQLGYVGNLGPLQDLEATLSALSAIEGLQVAVFGEGRSADHLRSLGLARVSFHGQIPAADVPHRLANCDLGIVSLIHGAQRAAYPSKIMTFLGLGIPLLAFLEPDSELANEITSEGLGYVVDASRPSGLREVLRAHRSLPPEEVLAMRRHCRDYAARFAARPALDAWTDLLGQLT